jgi:hypothetical protein
MHMSTHKHTTHYLFSCMALLDKVNDAACLAMFFLQNRTCFPPLFHTCVWLHLTMFVPVYTMPFRLLTVPGVTPNEFQFLSMDHGFSEDNCTRKLPTTTSVVSSYQPLHLGTENKTATRLKSSKTWYCVMKYFLTFWRHYNTSEGQELFTQWHSVNPEDWICSSTTIRISSLIQYSQKLVS